MGDSAAPTLASVVFRARDHDLLAELDGDDDTAAPTAGNNACSSDSDADCAGFVFGEPAGPPLQRGGAGAAAQPLASREALVARAGAGVCPPAERHRRLLAVLHHSTEHTLQVNYASQQYEAGYYSWHGIGAFVAGGTPAEWSGRVGEGAAACAPHAVEQSSSLSSSSSSLPSSSLPPPPNHVSGQRDPRTRLRVLARHYDWADKVVFDIGCNQGGMLLPLAHAASAAALGRRPIRQGVGIDGDAMLVNCATALSHVMGCAPFVSFYTWNLDEVAGGGGRRGKAAASVSGKRSSAEGSLCPRHRFLDNFLPTAGADCIFLLSMCQWVRSWRSLMRYCRATAPVLFFEVHGNHEQQQAQLESARECYKSVQDLHHRERGRRLFLCSNLLPRPESVE